MSFSNFFFKKKV